LKKSSLANFIRLGIWICLLLFSIFSETTYSAKQGYSEGDWVSIGAAKVITSIAMDNNNIYFATQQAGILRFDRFSERWEDPLTTSDGFPSNRIKRIAFDIANNELWLDTDSGVGIYEPTFQDFVRETQFPSQMELPNSTNFNPPNLFPEFGYTYFPGYIIDPQGRKFYITKIITDDRYRAWIGFAGLGAAVANTRNLDLKFLPFGPLSEDQRVVISNDDYLFCGGYPDADNRSGISRMDFSSNEWKHFEAPYEAGMDGSQYNCATIDGDTAWFGSASGLIMYDTKRDRFKTFTVFNGLLSNYISAVKADGKNIWVGTDNGVNLIRFGGKKGDSLQTSSLPRDQSLVGNFIYDIEIDTVFVYIAANGGLFYRPENGDYWHTYSPSAIGGGGDITAILPTPKGLWLGRKGAISYFNPVKEIRREYSPSGLGNAIINQIISIGDKIFAGTDNGLVGINPITGESRLFTENDGLAYSQVYSLTVNGDYLWMATPKGLTKAYITALRIY